MSRPTVKWEITRSCDLTCRHSAKPDDDRRPATEELSTYEAYKTVDQIASLNPRQLIIAGGDPLARSDVFQIVDYARHRGLKPAIELVPTANLTAEAIDKLNGSGVATFIFSIDGATPARHNLLTGLRGSFERTADAIDWARKTCLPIEVNTMLTRRSISDLVPIGDLLSTLGVAAWNVLLPVPVEAARKLDILTAAEAERALAVLAGDPGEETLPDPHGGGSSVPALPDSTQVRSGRLERFRQLPAG